MVGCPRGDTKNNLAHPINSLVDLATAAAFAVPELPPSRVSHDGRKNKDSGIGDRTIEKTYGKGSIMRLGNRDVLVPVSVISTGSISLDAALGVGGLPRGRVVEIYGPESGGKTTLTLHVIAEAQKLGGQAAFIDAEHALESGPTRGKLGVDVDNLLVSATRQRRAGLEIAER